MVKIRIFLLLSALLLLLSGCGGSLHDEKPDEAAKAFADKINTPDSKQSYSENSSNISAGHELAEKASAIEGSLAAGKDFPYDTSEFIEFTVYWNYNWWPIGKEFDETLIGRELGSIMNCRINYSKPDGDALQKLYILSASDNLPDVIVMDRDVSYFKLACEGKLVELDSYIDKYPGYKGNVDPFTIDFSRIGGKIYGLLNWPTTKEHPTGNTGWMVNNKIYKALGSPPLDNFDNLYAYLLRVRDGNFKEGGMNVVPMQFRPDQKGIWQLYFNCGGIPSSDSDHELVYVDNAGDAQKNSQTGEARLKFVIADPRFKTAMLYANKLWRAGLINSDYFVETSRQKDEKRDKGRLAVYTSDDLANELRDGLQAWKATDSEADYKIIEPPAGPGIRQEYIRNTGNSRLGWNCISITKKAKYPERIFEVFDYIASDEGQLLTFYGPKGILWDKLDENGFPILKKNRSDLCDEELKTLAAEKYSLPGIASWVDASKLAADSRNPPGKRDIVIQAQSQVIWKHALDLTEFDNLFTYPNTYEDVVFKKTKDLVVKMLPRIVTAPVADEAERLIDKTVSAAYMYGFDRVEKLKTEKWKQNIWLLNKQDN